MESFTSKETAEVEKHEKSASNIWGNNLHVVNQCYLTTNSYVFYKVANLYDLTCTILYDLSRLQWQVGLGAGLGVGRSYKFIGIVQLVKYVRFSKNRMNLYEWVRTN